MYKNSQSFLEMVGYFYLAVLDSFNFYLLNETLIDYA